MIRPFEHIEVIESEQFDENTSIFNLTTNSTPKISLLRGIVGSMKIKHTISHIEFEQSIDYLDPQGKNASKSPFERIKEYLSEDISLEQLSEIFKNKTFLNQNKAFFEHLNQEFNNFYYYQNKGSHTTAFAFVYRILEKISYAFPLIYAAKTSDFIGTYTFIKSINSPSKDSGELNFFKRFIKTLFKSDPAFKTSITIDIMGETEEIQQYYFNSFKKACPEAIFDNIGLDEPRSVQVKFTEYSSFIISLRNRFFHLLSSGQPNLQSDDILDADSFFKLVNSKSIYWISIVLFEILKYNIEIETRI